MQDPQPSLPFDQNDTLEEIRRLLEVQNSLLQVLVERLTPAYDTILEGDDLFQLLDDDAFYDVLDEDEIPEPPDWFSQAYEL